MPFVSRPNERDRSIERLLQESFRKPEAGVTDSCLDAETLAAFSDGGLAGEALELAQTHLADCARCQGIIGAAIRVRTIARDPEPVRAGVPTSTVRDGATPYARLTRHEFFRVESR